MPSVSPKLSTKLETMYARYHNSKHLAQDPLLFPRRYENPEDQEVVALLAASMAFGRVSAFLPVLDRLFSKLGPYPATSLDQADDWEFSAWTDGFVYRFATSDNLKGMLLGIAKVRKEYGGLQPPFMQGYLPNRQVIEGLRALANSIRLAAEPYDPGFLLPLGRPTDPAKRLNMFLRWMVRDDSLDLGIWQGINKADLLIPMDVHVTRISRMLGLLPSKKGGPTLKDAIALTKALSTIDPNDPVRLDFALAHMGISGDCKGEFADAICPKCPLMDFCVHGRQGPGQGDDRADLPGK